MDYDIDLDALAPQSKKIKWQDKIIEIKPPTTKQLFAIMACGQRLAQNREKIDSPTDADLQTLDSDFEALKSAIIDIIPQLAGASLSIAQVDALSNIVIESAMPEQVKKLKERGIEFDSPKKEQAGS